MIRCKPLLGTFVEISIHTACLSQERAIDKAFAAIKNVQDLIGFHNPQSELSKINAQSYLQKIEIHPWTAHVLRVASEIYDHSHGLFNCGIGHRLVAAGLLPNNLDLEQHQFGGIEDLQFVNAHTVFSLKPLCLDLGGIAKGFAVDIAISSLLSDGIESGCVNAGGDLRVFGSEAQAIQIRNPAAPSELIHIGTLEHGAIATSSLYFSKRQQQSMSYVINPFTQEHIDFSGSYSVIANECIYADALTKVLAISGQMDHPCFDHFSAQAIRIAA